jgi:sugar/nucleoside kinase (ribokinase family)
MSDSIFSDRRLCVVGNINRDFKSAPLAPGEYLFRDGETCMPFLKETVGGGGANSAFAAATLGASVAFLGKVGGDALGARLETTLLRHGIDSRLARDQSLATGTSFNLNYATGQRHFISCLPNNLSLAFEDLDLNDISRYRHLLRSDVWFSDAMLFGGNERLFYQAKQAGLEVSLDLNWDPCWRHAPADQIRARKQAVRVLLPRVDLAHGNVRELNEFCDSDDLKTSLQRLDEWGVGAVVVHLGADGAGYYRRGEFWTEPAAPAERQINTTGTGDVLSVCMMLLHRDESLSVRDKLKLANGVVSEFIAGRRIMIPRIADDDA